MQKDEIYISARRNHLMVIGFLQMLTKNFNDKKSFELAKQGFANYMINYYKLVLKDTDPGSQDRFNTFRKHYESLAKQSTYLELIESSEKVLKVKFKRCPFNEVLESYDLKDYCKAFCLSDIAFTKELLPKVDFKRKCTVSDGDDFCDNSWYFN